ncbi:MAG: tRNA pseudouridine(13) synthase TruD [Thermoplasmata archaeon]|nr:MAG: tRNA pseudouridine(13) synthase TruD [Thermoplasmata archaeon]
MQNVPPEEKAVGMEVFFTHHEGIGGVIKQSPEDFIVEEVPTLPPPGDGSYTVAFVEAKNWETHQLIYHMARSLGISENAIGIAGIKDKRAITKQAMSFRCPMEKVMELSIPGVKIEILYRSYHPISRGELIGNMFSVIIRDVDADEERIKSISNDIEKAGGFPNFFGIQRFGITRPITHLVGKYMVLGDFKKAVMTYIANPIKGEEKESYDARKYLQETMDFSGALKMYPRKLLFERKMIFHLSEKPDDWEGALKKISKNLVRIFIHAYQSFLFNKILSRRIQEGIPINKVVEGDIVIPCDNEIVVQSRKGIMVSKDNKQKINNHIKKGKCFPTGAIIGYDTPFAEKRMGEIEKEVMEEEGISQKNFIISSFPHLSPPGMRRIILAPLKKINWEIDDNKVHLSFFLRKGCYATCLLREFMKANIYSY